MHNSNVLDYSFIYGKLKRVYELMGGKVGVDSAYYAGTDNFLVKSAQTVPMGKLLALLGSQPNGG